MFFFLFVGLVWFGFGLLPLVCRDATSFLMKNLRFGIKSQSETLVCGRESSRDSLEIPTLPPSITVKNLNDYLKTFRSATPWTLRKLVFPFLIK